MATHRGRDQFSLRSLFRRFSESIESAESNELYTLCLRCLRSLGVNVVLLSISMKLKACNKEVDTDISMPPQCSVYREAFPMRKCNKKREAGVSVVVLIGVFAD